MNSLLAIALFIAFMALLYLILLSRYGVLAQRLRNWRARHDRMVHEMEAFSQSKYRRKKADAEKQSKTPPQVSGK